MNTEGYGLVPTVSRTGYLEYQFYSQGRKGRIKKVIRFKEIVINNTSLTVYNLAFGDHHGFGDKIDDKVVSNNGDSEKILLTVARAVLTFTDMTPDALVFARGSTSSRTRFYSMNISSRYDDIRGLFHIFGSVREGEWELFRKNRPYIALLAKRK